MVAVIYLLSFSVVIDKDNSSQMTNKIALYQVFLEQKIMN